MRVLIAHDRKDVSDAIAEVVNSLGIPQVDVEITSDGTSTRRSLSHRIFDLMIIDLTLPHIYGRDDPSYSTVDNLLQEVFLLDDLFVPGDIIGITLDSDALQRISTSIGVHVMAIVAQDTNGSWKKLLADKIRYVWRATNTRLTSLNSQFDYDLLILTALGKELAPYREHFEFVENGRFKGASNFSFTDTCGSPRRGIAFAIGRSGEARAATYTQSLISVFRPKLAIMTGICGGRAGKVKLGDLVIAESALDWDYGKWTEVETNTGGSTEPDLKFLSRPGPIDISDSESHRLLRQMIDTEWFRSESFCKAVRRGSEGKITDLEAHLAPMASGSSVIASDEIMQRIVGLNEAIRGIDMEAFGFYHSAQKTHTVRPDFFCAKAVSDFSDGTKNDDFHSAACYASALFACRFIREIYRFDVSGAV